MCGILRSLAALSVLATAGCVAVTKGTLPEQPLPEVDVRATLPEVDVALKPAGDAQVVETAGPPADADVEEVVVVGSHVRRWLPIVGAAWPTSDCRLSVREVGDGALRSVFLADLGRSGRAWRHVAAHLRRAEGGRHLLVTLPGSAGNRPCTWRGAVLEEASRLTREVIDSTEGVALIGDDFGGRVALDVAAESEAGLVHNVVLFDLVPHEWPLQNTAVKAYRRMHTPTAFAAQARVAPPGYWSAASRLSALGADFAAADAQAEVRRTLRRSDPVTLSYEYFRGIGPRADLRPVIAAVHVPILSIWPAGRVGDEREGLAAVAEQYDGFDNVAWQAVQGYGAGAMLDAPELLSVHILRFWSQTGFPGD